MDVPVKVFHNYNIASVSVHKAGNVGENLATNLVFAFTSDWDSLAKTIVIRTPGGATLGPYTLNNGNSFPITADMLDAVGDLTFTVFGADGANKLINATGVVPVDGALPYTGSMPSTTFVNVVLECQNATAEALAVVAREEVIVANATAQAVNAETSADNAAQTFQDFLAMLGSDVATLDANGKLTPSQIPELSLISVYVVVDTTAMLALTNVQPGDVALIKPDDTVTDTYMLVGNDPSILSNWQVFGIGYVAESGHATSADAATDSQMINGHRVVAMTETQYASAVIDPDTYYIVTPD